MTTRLRHHLIVALTATALSGGSAQALTFNDLSGKWCGSVSSYTFEAEAMVVTLYSDNTPRSYRVDSYDYADTTITVNWLRDADKLFTTFGEFSAVNLTMVQQASAGSPRREFKRCS